MEREKLNALAGALVDHIYADRLVPAELFAAAERALGEELRGAAGAAWRTRSAERGAQGKPAFDPAQPLLLSRGFGASMAEDELAGYLPEEKILVNKDLFRGLLGSVDFAGVGALQERALLDKLQRESVGLRPEDVALYYNLIKVNQLAGAKRPAAPEAAPPNPEVAGAELLDLADKAFNLSGPGFAKINGGKGLPDRRFIIAGLADAIRQRKLNPLLLRAYLGRRSDKQTGLLADFLRRVCAQRGEDPGELIQYTAAYLLFNNLSAENLAALGLAAPLQAYVTDKIGKVRTVYYAAMLFILSFQFILLAQVAEVAAKYADAPADQQAKLRKLYEADDRRAMLISNSVNVASRKLTVYKAETREIMGAFKTFLSARGDIVQASDLFGVDYRN